tara:strand:- start:3182 stop:4375 length:1194 start_codon:yes stop_codon:yes gene_type:complete
MDKLITALDISKVDVQKEGENRSLTVLGTKGASFILQIVNDDGQFYNFETNAFATSSHIPLNNFKATLSSTTFTRVIQFPSVSSAATYKFFVIADPTTDTVLNKQGGVFSTSVNQVVNTTISFQAKELNTSPVNFASFASAKSAVGTPQQGNVVISFDEEINRASTDAGGFGLNLTRQPKETDLVFSSTQTVDGATSGSTAVVLDSVTDIAIGTKIVAVSSGSLSGTPSILSVDTATKTLTLSSAQTFADGITLTFHAAGPKAIYNATGVIIKKIKLSAFVPKDAVVTKTTRSATTSSTTIELDGTYGISGGNTVTYSGNGVNNVASNRVTSVSASASAGSIVVEAAQTILEGTLLTFKGIFSKVNVSGSFTVSKFGATNRTFNLIVDNFITPGTAS